MIDHNAYTLLYDELHEQAEWVACKLAVSKGNGDYNRTDNFRRAHKVETDTVTLTDYRCSGYDRGHLVPAADMSFSRILSAELI